MKTINASMKKYKPNYFKIAKNYKNTDKQNSKKYFHFKLITLSIYWILLGSITFKPMYKSQHEIVS
jgi:hypothetical protein